MSPAVLAVCAPSGTGKTTLLEKTVRLLRKDGWSVGTLKHCHHGIGPEGPGRDSYRLAEAGAAPSLAIQDPSEVQGLIGSRFHDCDIVLLEGFRRLRHPCFVLSRGKPDPKWRPPDGPMGVIELSGNGGRAAERLKEAALELMRERRHQG